MNSINTKLISDILKTIASTMEEQEPNELEVEIQPKVTEEPEPTKYVSMDQQLMLIMMGQSQNYLVSEEARKIANAANYLLIINSTIEQFDAFKANLGEEALEFIYYYWGLMITAATKNRKFLEL